MNGVGPDPLEARLSEALRSGLADAPVDGSALVEGAQRQVRRVRQRRAAAIVAAAALVLAVPVGYEVVHPPSSDYSSPAALLPAQSPSPLATLPDSLAFGPADLPPGVRLDLSLVSERVPVVSGQQCGAGPRPKTGRQWNWSSGSEASAKSVNLTVTRWADASVAFRALVTNTGACRWTDEPTEQSSTATTWSGTSDFSTLHYGRAVVRVGNLIAGVEVQSPEGTAAALATAKELASALTPKLRKAA